MTIDIRKIWFPGHNNDKVFYHGFEIINKPPMSLWMTLITNFHEILFCIACNIKNMISRGQARL